MRYALSLLILFLFNFKIVTAQSHYSRFDFSRYASVWVKSDAKFYKIDDNSVLAKLNVADMQLYIPQDNTFTSMPNGNFFINAFLINGTNKDIKISRIDATIDSTSIEVKIDGKWKLLQRNMGSSCGNSYYRTQLSPHNYWTIQVPIESRGTVAVPYRIVLQSGNKKIISNEAIVQLSETILSKAGTPIPQLSL